MTTRTFGASNAGGTLPRDGFPNNSPMTSHRAPQSVLGPANSASVRQTAPTGTMASGGRHPFEQSVDGSSRRTESARGPSDTTPLKSSLFSSPMLPAGFGDASFDAADFLTTRASPASGSTAAAANRADRLQHPPALSSPSSAARGGIHHTDPHVHHASPPSASQMEHLRNRCVMLSSCLEHTTSERDALAEMIRSVSAYRDTLLQDMFNLRAEKKELEDAVEQLQRDGAALRATLAEREQTISSLNGEQSARAECEKELASVRSQLRQLHADNESLAEVVHVLKAKVSDCESSLTAATVALENIRGERADAEKSLLEARVIESQMERLVLDREENLDLAEKKYAALDEERKSLQHQLSTAQQSVRQLEASYEALQRSHAALQARWTEATNEVSIQRQQREAAQQATATLTKQAEDAQRSREALAQAVAEATAERDRANTRYEDAKMACESLERKLDDAMRSRDGLLASESELRTRLEFAREREVRDAETISVLTCRANESNALLSSLRESRDIEGVEVTGLRNRQEMLQAENEELSAHNARVQAQLREAESSNATLSAKLEAAIAAHVAEKTELDAQLSRLRVQLEELQAVNAAACDFQRQANQLVQGSSLQRDFATEQLRATQSMLVNLQKKLAEEMDACQAADQRIAELVREKNEVLDELSSARTAAQDTAEQLTVAKDDRDSLAAEIRRSQQLWNSLIDEQAQMRAQLQRLMPPAPRVASDASPARQSLASKRDEMDDTRAPEDVAGRDS